MSLIYIWIVKAKIKKMFNFTLFLIIIFIVLLIISFFIEDTNLRICYWLVVMLLALSIFNIALAVTYYTKLRNEAGIPGPRGPIGDKGAKGPQGVCTVSDQCTIKDCKQKIVEVAHDVFPNVRKSCLSNVGRCTNTEKQIAKPISQQIEILTQKCNTTKMAEPDFMKQIRPSLVRLHDDGNINI
jgi:hypothetical protein